MTLETKREFNQTALIALVSVVFDYLFLKNVDADLLGFAKLLLLPVFLVVALNFNKKTLFSFKLLSLFFMTFIWLWSFACIIMLFDFATSKYY